MLYFVLFWLSKLGLHFPEFPPLYGSRLDMARGVACMIFGRRKWSRSPWAQSLVQGTRCPCVWHRELLTGCFTVRLLQLPHFILWLLGVLASHVCLGTKDTHFPWGPPTSSKWEVKRNKCRSQFVLRGSGLSLLPLASHPAFVLHSQPCRPTTVRHCL